MSEQFEAWFKNVFDNAMYSEQEKEELKTYTWLAWRDSRRAIGEPVAYYGDNGAYYNTTQAAAKDGVENITSLYEITQ